MAVYVILRIFVESPAPAAGLLAQNLEAQIGYPLSHLAVEAYYKFAGWHEISGVTVFNACTPNQALQTICLTLGSGWLYTWGETELDFSADAIWNPGPGCHFVWPETRFAHVLVSPEPPFKSRRSVSPA